MSNVGTGPQPPLKAKRPRNAALGWCVVGFLAFAAYGNAPFSTFNSSAVHLDREPSLTERLSDYHWWQVFVLAALALAIWLAVSRIRTGTFRRTLLGWAAIVCTIAFVVWIFMFLTYAASSQPDVLGRTLPGDRPPPLSQFLVPGVLATIAFFRHDS